jgi:hypothetical protein
MEGLEHMKQTIFYQSDIRENVANEFHYLMLGTEAFHLSREIAIAEHNLNSQFLRISQKDDGILMSLSKKRLRLIQRQR